MRLLLLLSLLAVSGAFVPSPSIRRTSISAVAVPEETATAAVTETASNAEEEESVEFPPPLSSIDRLKRGAQFWSTAVPIIGNYYGKFAEMKLREGFLGEEMSDEEIEVSNLLVHSFKSCALWMSSNNH